MSDHWLVEVSICNTLSRNTIVSFVVRTILSFQCVSRVRPSRMTRFVGVWLCKAADAVVHQDQTCRAE